jgi:glycosyltransferase involved in cell wall biosynthesis
MVDDVDRDWPVVLVGRDVHAPYEEMAAVQIRAYRKALGIPASRVVSLQLNKPVAANTGEIVVASRGRALSRPLQLARLLRALGRYPREQGRIVHYVGNGQRVLNEALAVFAAATRRQFFYSPLGSVYLPRSRRALFVTFLHPSVTRTFRGEAPGLRADTLAPFADFRARGARPSRFELLFCSVPHKASELAKKGLLLLFDAAKRLERLDPSVRLTVLNRHAGVAGDLSRLAARHELNNTSIVNEVVDDMRGYMQRFSALVIPFAEGPNVPVPMSAVEALGMGIPCVVPSWLPMAEDIAAEGAGALFTDAATLAGAVLSVRRDYDRCATASIRLAERSYSSAAALSKLCSLYRAALDSNGAR